MSHHPHDTDFNYINHNETLRLAETAETLSRIPLRGSIGGIGVQLSAKLHDTIATIVANIEHRVAIVGVQEIEEDHA